MARPKGSPKLGGRQKGTPNKASAAREAQIAATGLTPLQYLTSVYQDANADRAERIDAAKAAAPYVHAKLQPVDGNGSTAQTLIVETGVPRDDANS